MAVVTLTDVEVAVQEVVGTSTMLRARALALEGRVGAIRRDPEGGLLGRVRDGADEEEVRLPRHCPDAHLDPAGACCTCGAQLPCRHVAALFLAGSGALPSGTGGPAGSVGRAGGGGLRETGSSAGHGAPGRSREEPVAPAVPAWEGVLQAALGVSAEPGGAGTGTGAGTGSRPEGRAGAASRRDDRAGTSAEAARPPVGLQFELVEGTGRRIAIRLVTPGRAGGWVRSGVSWTSLAYPDYYLRHVPAAQVRLLRELHGLPTAHPLAYADRTLFLDDVLSRRVWDLLLEAQELGLPLVMAGKRSEPVRVHADPAVPRLLVRRDGEDLVVEAVLQTGGRTVGTPLPIGTPAHGIAWFAPAAVAAAAAVPAAVAPTVAPPAPVPAAGADVRTGALHLARLPAVPPTLFTRLAAAGPLRLAADQQEHFLAAYYPHLAEHVEVTCPDGSVALPVAQPPALELTVTTLGEHRVQLGWGWEYRLGDVRRHEPLVAPAGPAPRGRDLAAEARALERVVPVIATLPGVLQHESGELAVASEARLDGMATARLMAEVIPVLREHAEVEVRVLPESGPLPDYREVQAAPVIEFAPAAAPDVTGLIGDHDWFDLRVTVTVDGHEIPFEQLFVALAEGQSHLLLGGGAWFSLQRPEFAELARVIAESRELLDAPPATVRLSRFHAGLWEDLENLGTITGQVDAWRRRVRALAEDGGPAELKLPPGLEATLRPYQEDGFRRLATMFRHGLGGILADDMGLGKTVQALALILHAREHAGEQGAEQVRGPGQRSGGSREAVDAQAGGPDEEHRAAAPFLVVAPTSVVGNWAQQAAAFAPDLSVVTISQTQARRGAGIAEACAGADLVVTSYTLFRLEHEQYQQFGWAGLILDEAQNVKNHHSAGYRCARELPAGFKLAITGTPMENTLMELWSLLSITAPGLFPRAERFTDHYRTPIERNHDAERLAQLRRRIRPLVLRRSKEQVAADLPERQEQVLELPLLPKHRALYKKYLQRERQKVLGLLGDLNRNRFEILRSLTLLRQASIDPALVDPAHDDVPSTKLDALLEQLEGIVAEGHRVLVFSQFTRFLARVADRLDRAGVEFCYLDGRTRRRAEVISRFREGIAPVFLISLKAGGTGLNLTEADYVILLDPWWNPAVEAQAVDRAHRIGQTRNVMVYRMVAQDTIEEKVMALKERKAALTASVLDGDDLASAALTADDIRSLLS